MITDDNHQADFGLLGELLPNAANRVELADEVDRHGLPVAKVAFNLFANDKKIIEYAKRKTMEVMWAAGASEVVQEARYAHLVGAARMGRDPRDSVVDGFGRTHDIDNLFVCDGSILPTQGSANPGLTIMALAARMADYIIDRGASLLVQREPPAAARRHSLRSLAARHVGTWRAVSNRNGECRLITNPDMRRLKANLSSDRLIVGRPMTSSRISLTSCGGEASLARPSAGTVKPAIGPR